MKNILNTCLLTFAFSSVSLAAGVSDSAKSWLNKLSVPDGAYNELSKYPGLPSDYIESFPANVTKRVQREMEQSFGAVLDGDECVPKTQVEFLNQVTANASSQAPAVRDFESQVVHIQVLACLEGVTSKQVAAAFASAEFKRVSTDAIIQSSITGHRVCQNTRVAVLGESEYCYNDVVFSDSNANYVHSFNDWNRDNVKAPVYFREMLTATTDIRINGRAGTAFYTNAYVRGVKLPALFKSFARSAIVQAQGKSLQNLYSIATQK